MPSLTELVRSHTDLDADDVAWLQLIQADWQIIADLSFADLVLWLPDREAKGYWAGAQMRPTTGPTAYVDDVVGTFVPVGRRPMIDAAYEQGRLVREGDPEWRDHVPVRVETIPVRRAGRVIAVIARHTNLLGVRTPSRLELSYLQTAADLTQMIAGGHFPAPGQRSDHADSPRVGDGFVRIDAGGRVTYASPNAQSVYRRLGLSGDLEGLVLADVTRELVPRRRRPDEETVSAVLGGRAHRDTELGTDDVTLIVRSIPLWPQGEPSGALVLLRDVTDLRRRDRELVTKDATIREIHHRVKNNLQTVAALLRLQARRIDAVEAKGGAGGGGAPGRLDRDRARDAERRRRRGGRLRRDRRPARPDGDRGQRHGGAGAGRAEWGRSACCRRTSPPRWRWCSPRCCRTPSSTGTPRRKPAGSRSPSAGWWAGWRWSSRTTGGGYPTISTSTPRRAWVSRSCGRSWSPSWGVDCWSPRRRQAPGRGSRSTYR